MALEVIILAAGQGVRMKSELAKVLHPLGGKPMLQHVIDTAQSLQPVVCHVVIGHAAEQVRETLAQPGIHWVEQERQQGTGHAVRQALPAVNPDHDVLVLYGDVPLIGRDSLQSLLSQPLPALLTAVLEEPSQLGRIVRGDNHEFLEVVEYADASEAQRELTEINSGVLAATARQLENWLPRLGNDNRQAEYYLPQVLSLARQDGLAVSTVRAGSAAEVLGVNDLVELNRVEREYQLRLATGLMRQGVSLADARRLDIRGSLSAGSGVYIDANVVFEGEVLLGDQVHIGPNCFLRNVQLGAGVRVEAFSHLEGASVAAGCEIGPYARLRPGAQLAANATVGNFVEITQSDIGPGSKIKHLTYVGNSELGSRVNIGAGTITCNYDGAGKHQTRIGDDAFIGSNATLVAPVSVEDGAFVGAGSTVTSKVGKDELALGRAKQRNIRGWKRPKPE
ncbi:MAG: bifunctional UDP-N-acetylglucosamine diphosphorylase/glucosamine-1-phosphate N-acetyltransferase GlmU [Halieaceae bacterium]|nr:bifunctional UDP-N-acetylglucosamine diphosphorylase/glucosamine-1-phosphate N-acetyltransferase GlmU [Halieaceae bacterium]